MQTLRDILYGVKIRGVVGSTERMVNAPVIDSRKSTSGSLFIAARGVAKDGHQFIDTAIANGAIAVVCEAFPSNLSDDVTYVQVENSLPAAGIIAHNFFNRPSERLKLVGVTGTNGKTTIATLLYKLFTSLGFQTGLISTVQNHIGETVVPATHTTPDAISLNRLLHEMVDAGCSY
ncbi:MAG TPA: Mur ligase family protein, partial [Chitinophagaceae bacterium]